TAFDSTDIRSTVPRFTPEARQANRAMVDLLDSMAQRKGATPARIALARRLERLDENLGAADVERTPDDLQDIERAATQITVQGARYPEHLERQTYR